jgi:hypothetical protein
LEGSGGINLATTSKTLTVGAGSLTWGPVLIKGKSDSLTTTITSATSADTVTLDDDGLVIGAGGKITLTNDVDSHVASSAGLKLVGTGAYTVGAAAITLNEDGLLLPKTATLTFDANTGKITGYKEDVTLWTIGGAAAAITSVADASDDDDAGITFSSNAITGVVGGESFTIAGNTLTITADATAADADTTVELAGVIADVSATGTIAIGDGGVLKLAANGGIFAKASTANAAVYGNTVASEGSITGASGLPAASSVASSAAGYISSIGNGTSDTSVTGGASITNSKTFVAVAAAGKDDASDGSNDGKILVGSAL